MYYQPTRCDMLLLVVKAQLARELPIAFTFVLVDYANNILAPSWITSLEVDPFSFPRIPKLCSNFEYEWYRRH